MLQTLLTVLMPHGGQLRARRNAWAAMSECAVRGRAQREAEQAVEQAAERAVGAARAAR